MEHVTEKQEALIRKMNDLCDDQFVLSYPRGKYEASKWISEHMEEYKYYLEVIKGEE